MQTIPEETKKKVVKLHIQDGRTIASLAAEYGICHATVSNWIRAYREDGLHIHSLSNNSTIRGKPF